MRARWTGPLMLAAGALLLNACSMATPVSENPANPVAHPGATATASVGAPGSGTAGPNVAGLWTGGSEAYCGTFVHEPGRCFAQQQISFTLVQEESNLSGFYQCSFGNQICLRLDELGKIKDASLTTHSIWMRVMMADGMDCIFQAKLHGDKMNGGYDCLQGGGELEEGIWQTERAY